MHDQQISPAPCTSKRTNAPNNPDSQSKRANARSARSHTHCGSECSLMNASMSRHFSWNLYEKRAGFFCSAHSHSGERAQVKSISLKYFRHRTSHLFVFMSRTAFCMRVRAPPLPPARLLRATHAFRFSQRFQWIPSNLLTTKLHKEKKSIHERANRRGKAVCSHQPVCALRKKIK